MKPKASKKWIGLLLAFVITLSLYPAQTIYAAEDCLVTITGLENGDKVEIYHIATQDSEGQYTWVSAVNSWVSSSRAEVYEDLTPKGYLKGTEEEKKRFCEVLLMAKKVQARGVADIPGETFLVESDENSISLSPGIYIILPKGSKRIYELKSFTIEAEQASAEIAYAEEDYDLPSIESSVFNVTEQRGDKEYPIFYYNDSALVQSEITLPEYPYMYSEGKLFLSIAVILPSGMTYKEDSLKVQVPGEESSESSKTLQAENTSETSESTKNTEGGGSSTESYTELDSGKYSRQVFLEATIYTGFEGKHLFFGQEGNYFEMDGTFLVGPEASPEDALEAYNELHETELIFKEEKYRSVYDLLETEDKTATEDAKKQEEADAASSNEEGGADSNAAPVEGSSENAEGGTGGETTSEAEQVNLIETEAIEAETSVDETLLVEASPNVSVFIILLSDVEEIDKVRVTAVASKNKYGGGSGWLDHYTDFFYSVSALDANLRNSMTECARAGSYTIRITACQGLADTYTKSTDEVLKNAARMVDDRFKLYVFAKTEDGNTCDSEYQTPENLQESQTVGETAEEEEAEEEIDVKRIYDQAIDKTYVYSEYAELSVSSNGSVSIGGLEPKSYLIVQTGHCIGYSLSQNSLLLEEADWEDEEIMEDGTLFDVLWLDYATVYLPATGSYGDGAYRSLGALLMMAAALGLSSVHRRYKKN